MENSPIINVDLSNLEIKLAMAGVQPDRTGNLALDYGSVNFRVLDHPRVHKFTCGHEYASREVHESMLCVTCGEVRRIVR